MRKAACVLLLATLPQLVASQEYKWRLRLPTGNPHSVAVNPQNTNSVYAQTSSTSIAVSYDRGDNWSVLGATGLSTIRQILVHPADTSIIFACPYVGGGLVRSIDNGLSWTTVIEDFGVNVQSLLCNPIQPDTMYAGDYTTGGVFMSVNRGSSWQLQGIAGPWVCSMTIRSDSTNILLAGTGTGTISKSTDRGVTWRMVTSTGTAEVPRIAIVDSSPLIGYASTIGYDNEGIWKTTDGGETWYKTPLSAPLWGMDVNPMNENVVYSGTYDNSGLLYGTSNGGLTWNVMTNGLPPTGLVVNLKTHLTEPAAVLCACDVGIGEGKGIYRWISSSSHVGGAVLDAATGDTVRSGTLELVETGDVIALDTTGGCYRFSFFEGDSTLTPTVRVAAYPYYIHDEPIAFVIDSLVEHDILVNPLPRSSVTGRLRDATGTENLSGTVTLFSMTLAGPATFEVNADQSGEFAIDNLPISYPPILSYDLLYANPRFPFARISVDDIVLDTLGLDLEVYSDTADVVLSRSMNSTDYSSHYTSSLEFLDITFNISDPSDSVIAPLSHLSQTKKNSLIYYTGSDSTVLREEEADSLTAAVTAGGHLFITGQNFVEANGASVLVSDILGIGFGGKSPEVVCEGVQGDLFAGMSFLTVGGTGAGNQTSRDILIVNDDSAVPTIRYGTDGLGGSAAIRIDHSIGGGKIILFGFGFESVFASSFRSAILDSIIGYFDGSITVDVPVDDRGNIPKEFSLDQNYPNPFNATTTIRFILPKSSDVTLTIYNLLGEESATLLHSVHREAGTHTLLLDATGYPSGVYFYRLRAGEFVETRKLVLLR